MTERAHDGFVPVAEVVKAVGLRGEVKLYPLINWHAPLLEGAFLEWADGAALRVVAQRQDRGGVVVGLEGVDDRAGAERLVGREIGFLRARYQEADFPKPRDGLPFRFVGRPVVTAAGQSVGRVCEVRRYASQLLLVIARGAEEVLVPAVAPILRPDEGMSGPLVIDPPAGLLDGAGD